MSDEQYDPNEHTVQEVNDYLASLPADDDGAAEYERVYKAEQAGQNRSTVKAPAPAPQDPQEGAGTPEATTTKAQTFQDAAEAATPADRGYLGYSPEAERTGRADKGLSQQNPAVMRGGPLPDPRPGVDDSEAIAALKDQG